MWDVKTIEYPTLKVPYELLNKKFRTAQKNIDREVSHVTAATQDLEKSIGNGGKIGEIRALLSNVVEKLNLLKRKADESIGEEVEASTLCKRRVEHLKEGLSDSSETGKKKWCRIRLHRILVEYFMRTGFYETAMRLAEESNIRDLTNIDMFLLFRDVEESLKRKDIQPCIAWCYDNRSKLRKMRSTLEFELRKQEFIELIRKDQRMEAVKLARKHLSSLEAHQYREVQHLMALLALGPLTAVPSYEDYFRDCRWRKLIELFRQENYRLYQLSIVSVLSVTLQAGLSVLKTPQCYKDSHQKQLLNSDCPVCSGHFNELAKKLPYAHCANSRLICSISGEDMNEHNPPLMLPNGNVYGRTALEKMSEMYHGKITCPRSGQIFSLGDCKKVFVM